MSETSNTDLIAEARTRTTAHARQNPEGSVDLIFRLVNALESSTATLTETEADLQASRGREEALQAKITAALVFADEAGEIDHEESNFAAGANAVAAIFEVTPSPDLEAEPIEHGLFPGTLEALDALTDIRRDKTR